MKNAKKLLALILALSMVISIVATTSFAATTGTGTQMDPYVCESVSDIPATLDLDAGQVVYFTAPIGGQAVTVSDSYGWVCIYNQMGIATGETVYDTTGAPEGYPITFAVGNQNPMRPTTATITVGAAPVAEEGTEGNPKPVEYNSMFGMYLLNDALEAEDQDGLWYTFTAYKSGILYLNTSCTDHAYTVDVYVGENAMSSTNTGTSNDGDPIILYPVTEGDTVIVHKYADYEGLSIPAATININAYIVDGTAEDPVPIKTDGSRVPVAAGQTLTVIDGSGLFSGCGLIISGYSEAIKVTTVTVGGVEYTDVDGDGTIELTWTGSYYSRNPLSITNGHEWNIGYTLTTVESAEEGAPAHNPIYFEAVAPGCHSNGNIEYWYCPDCEGFWQDEALTQLTNSKNVILPATGSENVQHVDAIAPACHYDGNIEYWYCPDCEGFWQNEALTQLTNSKNVVLPATGSENVQHVDAIAPACHYDGNIEYWYCADCQQFWQNEALTQLTNSKNVVLPATGSENLTYTAAVAPSCYAEGNIEYWYCADCQQFWQNEALTQLTNAKSVILPATHQNVVHQEAVAPACHYDGNIEYWYCADCQTFWQNEGQTELTNAKNVVLPATGSENVQHVDAIAPACHYDGNIEYWYCADCQQFWQNEALTQLTNAKNVVLPATGSENLTYTAAVAPSCYAEGNIEYWYCADCQQFWQNEALTQLTNAKSVILPATHQNVVHFDAVAPACHYDGNIEYWYCADCLTFWQNEGQTELTNAKNVILPATGSENVVHFEAVVPACHYDGNIEYWYCADCQQFWQNEALTQLTNAKNVILPATGSENVKHVEAVAATTESEGNVEYWYCADCEQFWLDEAGTKITNAKSVITPKLEVVPETTAPETTAPETTAPESSTPKTGDTTPVVALIIMSVLAISGLAVLVIGKKKFSV